MLPKVERNALSRLVAACADGDTEDILDAMEKYAVTRARLRQKTARDARTDAARRCLVGARLDRDVAERVRCAARDRGQSVYRFISDAVLAHLAETEGIPSPGPEGWTVPRGPS